MVANEVNRVNAFFEQTMEQPMKVVEEYPVSTMLAVFGFGMAMGLLVIHSSMSASEPESTSERLTRQISDSVHRVLPKNVADRMFA